MIVPRMTAGKRSELESFWRAKLKHEESALAGKLLHRRGGLRHMSRLMTKEIVSPPSGYIPSARPAPSGARRRFSEADTLAPTRRSHEALPPGTRRSPTIAGLSC